MDTRWVSRPLPVVPWNIAVVVVVVAVGVFVAVAVFAIVNVVAVTFADDSADEIAAVVVVVAPVFVTCAMPSTLSMKRTDQPMHSIAVATLARFHWWSTRVSSWWLLLLLFPIPTDSVLVVVGAVAAATAVVVIEGLESWWENLDGNGSVVMIWWPSHPSQFQVDSK